MRVQSSFLADLSCRVHLICMKHIGKCPCPRCLINKDKIKYLGTDKDRHTRERQPRMDSKTRQNLVTRACNKIFKEGASVTSAAVKRLLDAKSLVPTIVRSQLKCSSGLLNLSRMLSRHFFLDLARTFTDFSHRIPYTKLTSAYGSQPLSILSAFFTASHELQQQFRKWTSGQCISFHVLPSTDLLTGRFRMAPSFGRVIHQFGNNVSEMKKLAGHHFENILQVSSPLPHILFIINSFLVRHPMRGGSVT